jgi:uncharacterized membrane protein YciS (DUF1049 family)
MLKNLIEQAQANLPVAILFAAGLIWFLLAIAQYYVDYAKITPDKADDEKAKRFKLHVQAFVKFLKNLFRIGKKDKDNKGFVSPMLLVGLVCGVLISAAIFKLVIKPKEVIVEKEKIVYVEVEKKQEATKKVTKIKTNSDGSSETNIVEESDTQVESFLAGRVEKVDKKLGIYLGAGLQSNSISKPFASGIITYDPYALSAQSDFVLDHRAAFHLGFRF